MPCGLLPTQHPVSKVAAGISRCLSGTSSSPSHQRHRLRRPTLCPPTNRRHSLSIRILVRYHPHHAPPLPVESIYPLLRRRRIPIPIPSTDPWSSRTDLQPILLSAPSAKITNTSPIPNHLSNRPTQVRLCRITSLHLSPSPKSTILESRLHSPPCLIPIGESCSTDVRLSTTTHSFLPLTPLIPNRRCLYPCAACHHLASLTIRTPSVHRTITRINFPLNLSPNLSIILCAWLPQVARPVPQISSETTCCPLYLSIFTLAHETSMYHYSLGPAFSLPSHLVLCVIAPQRCWGFTVS